MSYAGDKNPRESWEALVSSKKAQLLDVRTVAEWNYSGVPTLEEVGKTVKFVEWQTYPAIEVNKNFVAETQAALESDGVEKSTPIFTICSAGIRSIAAAEALTKAGYLEVYNILHGFDGSPDHSGERGRVSGWKYEGLPWKQQA